MYMYDTVYDMLILKQLTANSAVNELKIEMLRLDIVHVFSEI